MFSIATDKISVNLKSSHKISIAIRINIMIEFNSRLLSLENEFKWVIKDHVNAYLGMKYSIDGWQYLVGLKLAGIKFKIPLLLIDNSVDRHLDDKNVILKFLSVCGVFLGGSYIMKKLVKY